MNGSSSKLLRCSGLDYWEESNKDIILELRTGIVHMVVTSSLDVAGNIRAVGDVIAQRYIVSSSVTHLTQSFQ